VDKVIEMLNTSHREEKTGAGPLIEMQTRLAPRGGA
jgi:hypothetical protein